jgi:rubrerythrin
MGGIGSTAENLQAAIDGETHEYTAMYPPMLERAQSDGHRAKRMFDLAMQAEEVHAGIYKRALETIQQGKDFEATDFYLCPACGHIEIGSAPEACPICYTPGVSFVQV